MIIDYLIAPFLKKKGAFIYNDLTKNVIKFVIIKVQKEAKNNNKKEVILILSPYSRHRNYINS